MIGTLIHEALHGITWAILGKKSFRNIHFGVDLKKLTPYCHFKVPIKKNAYIIGTLMPFLVLGLCPMIISILCSSLFTLFWGILFTFAASGDLVCYWNIKKIKSQSYILDHPEKLGCIIQ